MLIWERRLAVIATDLAIQYDELVRLRARVKSALAAPSPQGGGSAERTRLTAARRTGVNGNQADKVGAHQDER
jgi:hypothetical protein